MHYNHSSPIVVRALTIYGRVVHIWHVQHKHSGPGFQSVQEESSSPSFRKKKVHTSEPYGMISSDTAGARKRTLSRSRTSVHVRVEMAALIREKGLAWAKSRVQQLTARRTPDWVFFLLICTITHFSLTGCHACANLVGHTTSDWWCSIISEKPQTSAPPESDRYPSVISRLT